MAEPSSDRTRVRRGAHRAVYERHELLALLDAGMVAHVGVVTDDGPVVLPMAYGRTDDTLLLHGAAANAMLRAAVGTDVCVTVTLTDGLVVARTPFNNSMNYRSVVVRGVAAEVTDPDQKWDALKVITDHITPVWNGGRPPTDTEVRATRVLSVPLHEMSGKVRTGPPIDADDDLSGPWWAGVVPLTTTWGAPVPADDLPDGVEVPEGVAGLAGRLSQ